MSLDHDGPLVHLDDAECRRLLATVRLGRLGFTDRALPAIMPVAYAVHAGAVVFRVRRADSITAALSGAVVALEVDSFRDEDGRGWSITVVGPTRILRPADPVGDIHSLGLFPVEAPARHDYVVLQLGLVRGWRVGDPDPAHVPPEAASAAATHA